MILGWTRLLKTVSLEKYDAMRKTKESEREAKDPITGQINKYARDGGRRYPEPSGISKIDPFTDPKDEILSVKMHQTKAIRWNQAKPGDDAAEKLISDDARKTFAETTQLLENVLEQSSKSSLDVQSTQNQTPDAKEGASSQRRARSAGEAPGTQQKNGKKENDELRNSKQNLTVRTQDLWRPRMQRRPKVVWRSPMMARGEFYYAYLINVVINEAYLVPPIRRGGPLERMLQWEVTRRWPRQREWLMAPHQWWPLNAYLAKSQDPEADGGPDDNVSLAPADPEAPPISVGCAQSMEPTEPRRKLRAWT